MALSRRVVVPQPPVVRDFRYDITIFKAPTDDLHDNDDDDAQRSGCRKSIGQGNLTGSRQQPYGNLIVGFFHRRCRRRHAETTIDARRRKNDDDVWRAVTRCILISSRRRHDDKRARMRTRCDRFARRGTDDVCQGFSIADRARTTLLTAGRDSAARRMCVCVCTCA